MLSSIYLHCICIHLSFVSCIAFRIFVFIFLYIISSLDFCLFLYLFSKSFFTTNQIPSKCLSCQQYIIIYVQHQLLVLLVLISLFLQDLVCPIYIVLINLRVPSVYHIILVYVQCTYLYIFNHIIEIYDFNNIII